MTASGSTVRAVHPRSAGPVWSFVVAFILLWVWYRVRLGFALYAPPVPIMDLIRELVGPAYTIRFLLGDLAVAAAFGALVWCAYRLLTLASRVFGRRDLGGGLLGAGLALAVLLTSGLIAMIHLKLMVLMNAGLTTELLHDGFTDLPTDLFLAAFGPGDWAMVGFPLVAFWLLRRLEARSPRRVRQASAIATLGVLLPNIALYVYGLTLNEKYAPDNSVDWTFAAEIRENPVWFLAADWASSALRDRLPALLPGPRQMESIQLVDSAFVFPTSAAPKPAPRPVSPSRWNVVLVILESTGAGYALEPDESGVPAMPFLASLAEHGLWLTNHFSTANSSFRAIFSLMTGLYPRPSGQTFETLTRLRVPTLNRLLGPGYDAFLVTPGRLNWYFPRGLFENNGFAELSGYETLPPDTGKAGGVLARPEPAGMKFFLGRLSKATEPFFAVYYSFAPHNPYYDYGPEFRIRPDTSNALDRYYNNLRLVDVQLRRIYDGLRERGTLDRTILVVVGDHGEEFGKHPGAYIHGHSSYNEEFRVPAVIYQPRVVPARRIGVMTSHVDIVPTVLDAAGIPLDTLRFQGEPVLQGIRRRKYVFTYGTEGTLSSLSGAGLKVQVSFKDGNCWVYDLPSDPDERQRLSCASHRAAQEALLKFRNYESSILLRYMSGELKTEPK